MDEVPLTLSLELDAVGDALGGRLLRTGHPPVVFQGWLGLAVALAQLTAPPEGVSDAGAAAGGEPGGRR